MIAGQDDPASAVPVDDLVRCRLVVVEQRPGIGVGHGPAHSERLQVHLAFPGMDMKVVGRQLGALDLQKLA